LPHDQPLREPIIGPDGQVSRRWKEYFAHLDTDQGVSADFEAESRVTVGGPDHSGDVRRLMAQQRHPPQVQTQDRRVSRILSLLREMQFLES
jgi:hypothetical protein